MSDTQSPKPSASPKVRFCAAWFAGIDLQVFATNRSERRFYNSLGLAIAALSCLSGCMFAVAVSFWLAKPVGSLWWVGVLWALFMACCIEPLIYQTGNHGGRSLWVAMAPRILLSLMLAFQVAEPALLWINRDDITSYLTTQNTALAQMQVSRTQHYYGLQIDQDQTTIARIRGSEDRLQSRIDQNDFLASCEADTPSCSTTHEPGCGSYCEHYKQLAATYQAELDSVEPTDRRQISQLLSAIAALTTESKHVSAQEGSATVADTGLPARERALSALEAKNFSTLTEAWFIRCFLLLLDLLPLTVKFLRMRYVRSPYEETMSALREEELLAAHVRREQLRALKYAATAEADADIAIAHESARVRSTGRINEMWRRFRGETVRRRRP